MMRAFFASPHLITVIPQKKAGFIFLPILERMPRVLSGI